MTREDALRIVRQLRAPYVASYGEEGCPESLALDWAISLLSQEEDPAAREFHERKMAQLDRAIVAIEKSSHSVFARTRYAADDPWADFLAYRLRLLDTWRREGKSPKECVDILAMDEVQVKLLWRTAQEQPEYLPVETVPLQLGDMGIELRTHLTAALCRYSEKSGYPITLKNCQELVASAFADMRGLP